MLNHATNLLALAVLLGTAMSGCTPRNGIVKSGGETIPGSMEQICYVYQAASPSVSKPTPVTPLFAVVWRARMVGGTSSHSDSFLTNCVSHIHGHPISPDLKTKAVYALQPDYSLKKLNLTPAETSQLFAVMQVREGALLRDDELFKAKVFPQLTNVEWPDEANDGSMQEFFENRKLN